MLVRVWKFTSSIYVNKTVKQGLVNMEKPCVIFLNKAKHMIKSTSMQTMWGNLKFFKAVCSRGSLMTQFTKLDIEKKSRIKMIKEIN